MATVVKDAAPGSLPAKVPEAPLHHDARADGEANDDETESEFDGEELYEDILAADLDKWEYGESSDTVCSKEESDHLRKRLRDVGVEQFIRETLMSGKYSALKLCSAFRVVVPGYTEEDEALYPLLGFALHRELSYRRRLEQYQTIDDAASLLNSAKNILVITGAGISTSLGIPDFRSKHTGFYSKLREEGFEDPESLFSLDEFDMDPKRFYSLAGDLLPVENKWSPTHQFIRLLQDKGKLLRNYTQNIDNVESYAGINTDKIIHCHGSWRTASCRKCKSQVPGETIFESLRKRTIATCKNCERMLRTSAPLKRKRSYQGNDKPRKRGEYEDDEDEDDDIPEPGVMKPDITFFGENLPDKFYDTLNNIDREAVDLIIVIGTSMKVAPVSEIPQHVSNSVPQILISRDPVRHIEFDINLLGFCDTVVQELCRRAGWGFSHPMTNPDDKIDVKPHETLEWAYTVTTPESPRPADTISSPTFPSRPLSTTASSIPSVTTVPRPASN